MEVYQVRLIDKNGVQTTLNDENLPDGMENFDLTFTRSKTYFTIFNNFSAPLGFILVGKDTVDFAYTEDGVDAKMQVIIDIQNEETLEYDQVLISGSLDFHNRKWDSEFTEIPIIDGSKKARFTERDEIDYNSNSLISTDSITMPVIGNIPTPCQYSEYEIALFALFAINNPVLFTIPFALYLTDVWSAWGHTGDVIDNEINDTVNASPIITGINYADQEAIYSNLTGRAILVAINMDVSSTLNGYIDPLGASTDTLSLQSRMHLRVHDSSGNIVSSDTIISFSDLYNISVLTPYSFSQSATYNKALAVPIGGSIHVYFIFTVKDIENPETVIKLSANSSSTITDYIIIEQFFVVPETASNTVLPFELLSKLIQLATSETDTTKLLDADILGRVDSNPISYPVDGALSLLAITNGFNLRDLNRGINLSISDLFKSLDALGNIGLWFNNATDTFEVKEKKEYYRDDIIMDLGEFETLEIIVANDLYVNDISGGYDTDDAREELTGTSEVNGKTTNSTPTEEKNKLDIRCIVSGDTTGIVSAIAKRFVTEEITEDLPTDKENFITQMKRFTDGFITGFVTETGRDFASVEGLNNGAQYYNLRRTPKRNLLINSSRITPSFWKKTAGSINSISTRNDIPLETQLLSTDPIIKELANESVFITIEVVGGTPVPVFPKTLPPLYDPDYYIAKAPIGRVEVQQLLSDPHGTVKGTYRGVTYYGFVEEISTNSFTEEGNIKLIKNPNL